MTKTCPRCRETKPRSSLLSLPELNVAIERLTLPDMVIHESGGNMTYYVGNLGIFPKEYWSRLEYLPSRKAALDALSTVCVEYGRVLGGLPDDVQTDATPLKGS